MYDLTLDGVRRLINESGCDLRVTCFPYESASLKFNGFADRDSHEYPWDHELHVELSRLSGVKPDNKTVYAITPMYVEFHDRFTYISDEMYVRDHDILANKLGYQIAVKFEQLQLDTGLSREQMLEAIFIASEYIR